LCELVSVFCRRGWDVLRDGKPGRRKRRSRCSRQQITPALVRAVILRVYALAVVGNLGLRLSRGRQIRSAGYEENAVDAVRRVGGQVSQGQRINIFEIIRVGFDGRAQVLLSVRIILELPSRKSGYAVKRCGQLSLLLLKVVFGNAIRFLPFLYGF